MTARMSVVVGLTALIGCIVVAAAPHAAPAGATAGPDSSPRARIVSRLPRFRQQLSKSSPQIAIPSASGRSQFTGTGDLVTASLTGDNMLPVWRFTLRSPRDGNPYVGTVVGRSPYNPGRSKIRTQIVPLIVRTHRIATSVDPNTFNVTTIPGETTVDPAAADNTCMTAPNNVPLTVVRQSPIFTPTKFVVGGTDVGTTQYVDAYLRSSFWNILGSRETDYHTLLDPVQVADPILLDVPPNEGVAITDPQFFAAFGFAVCAPVQLIDWSWFDSYLRGTVLPGLPDVDPASLPIFFAYDAVWSYGVDNFLNCCVPGWLSVAGYPIPRQTFTVATFDRSNLFVGPSTGLDVELIAQTIGDWTSDPYIVDNTPAWGNTPGVVGCTDGFAAADPLLGASLSQIAGANGFSYHLQELAFFQWFFGLPSTGVNGWFSMGGTFRTDAGPICP